MPYGTRSPISTAKHYLLILPSLPTTVLFAMHHTLSIGALQHNSLLEGDVSGQSASCAINCHVPARAA